MVAMQTSPQPDGQQFQKQTLFFQKQFIARKNPFASP